jgi:hypothetical protein
MPSRLSRSAGRGRPQGRARGNLKEEKGGERELAAFFLGRGPAQGYWISSLRNAYAVRSALFFIAILSSTRRR